MSSIIPVVLSGGAGTRLWPLSREQLPKQLLSLTGGSSTLLQQTLERVREVPGIRPPILVCNEDHRFMVLEQAASVGVACKTLILEPVPRGTAPAVALAARSALDNLADATEDPLLLVLPADHLITDVNAFRASLEAANPLASRGFLVAFGVAPTRPETGFGYIRRGDPMPSGDLPIEQFVEKPDSAIACEFVASGRYLWNSGMFLFSARTYLAELERHAADIASACLRAASEGRRDGLFWRANRVEFEACRSDSIDYAVMERSTRGRVVPLEAGWSDIGSWSSLLDSLARDSAGNAFRGDVVAEDTERSLVIAQSRLVAVVGLQDHVVIETKDAVLVIPTRRVQDVREVVAQLRSAGRAEHVWHREVHRPWGSFDSVESGVGYQVKRLNVKPGGVMSLQRHLKRAEHWVVVSGTARVTRGDEVFTLKTNESTFIPVGVKHRIENPGPEILNLIEVQTGNYLGEDDIERFDDRYGR